MGGSSLVNALCGSTDEVLGIIGTAEDAIWSTFWKEHKNHMQTDSDG
jgi:hypothetical protein